MKKILTTSLIALSLTACAVQQMQTVTQPSNTELVAGIGDTIIQVQKKQSLPNVIGQADIFGRTTSTGQTLVKYVGIKDGYAFFERKSTSIHTGETTMNVSPMLVNDGYTATHNGFVGGIGYSGTTQVNKEEWKTLADKPETKVLDNTAVMIPVNLNEANPMLIVDGNRIDIIKATSSGVVYKITSVNVQ